mgnify:CR=1 FL=1
MAEKSPLELLEDFKRDLGTTSQPFSPTPTSTINQGTSLYDMLSTSLSQEVIPSDRKTGALHGLGALAWNALDSALLGVPGIAAEKAIGERPYDVMNGKTEGLATFGGVVGQGIGFLAPMKVIGTGVKLGVSVLSKKGTSKHSFDESKREFTKLWFF